MMNRHQNELSLNLVNPETGASKILLEESNKYYIDITDNLILNDEIICLDFRDEWV